MPSRNENAKAKAPEKSEFTRRCGLLSRYLKEKGSFGHIDLGLFRKPDPYLGLPGKSDPPGKLNLMQKAKEHFKVEPSNSFGGKVEDIDLSESQLKSSQLTIFFGGKVLVYNEFPTEKAKEIMEAAKQTKPVTETNIQTQINVENNSKSNLVLPDLNELTKEQQQNQIVERIARRASLHRFFAKRKDRAVARAPYQVNQNENPPKLEIVAGQPLEPGQSSQRPDNAIAQTKSDGDNNITTEIEEGQSSKDLDLRL